MLQQLPPEGPKRLRNQLAFDYAFLGCYWFVFIGLAMLLARRGGIGFDLPALGIALGGTATAVVDVLENLRTAGLVSSAGPDPHVRLQPIRHLRATSRLKWILSSSTLALVAVLFFAGSGWAVMVGVALLLTAGIGVIAAATGSAMLIKGYLLLFLLFGAVVAVWLTGWPANAYFHLS
jgi:hypothetical protein